MREEAVLGGLGRPRRGLRGIRCIRVLQYVDPAISITRAEISADRGPPPQVPPAPKDGELDAPWVVEKAPDPSTFERKETPPAPEEKANGVQHTADQYSDKVTAHVRKEAPV